MAIGDQVLLTVTVELANGYTLRDPGVPRAIGDFEVVDTLTVLETRIPAGVTRTQLRFLITAFALGPKRLPVIGVTYRARDGTEGQASTPTGHVIDVQSVVQPGEDASDIKPLKPPLPLPGAASDLSRLAPFVAIGVLILAAAVLALRVRRRGPILVETASHGPARAALDELERVLELRLPEQGRTREHYELIAAALRTFIVQRYGLAAHARTARELRRELERAGAPGSAAQLLCEVLTDAEGVRYEGRAIFPARAQKSMRDLIELMRKSVVAEEYELVTSGATA
ncbi:MAG: hypothetical protein HYY42_03885 [Chloroflexi bacterium]|nr:hypothetical protein [Chloroflexota bacterium]